MIVIIDNYDSFTYNLYQYVGEMEGEVVTVRNDMTTVDEIRRMKPDGIILSPGPGRPEDAGICVDIAQKIVDIPILGICLGHQAVGYAHGGKVIRAPEIKHGKTSKVIHYGKGLFEGLKSPVTVMRYHSLVLERESLADNFIITAQTGDWTVMGIRHKKYPIYGLQFHPESIMTESGRKMIENFLNVTRNSERIAASSV